MKELCLLLKTPIVQYHRLTAKIEDLKTWKSYLLLQ